MQIISSQVPYVGKSRNAEHDYLFNKLVEAISKEFATKHNFLAYHQRMTAALADENASYTRTTKYVDTDTLVQKDNARDNLFRRLKLHLQSAELDPDADTSAAAARMAAQIADISSGTTTGTATSHPSSRSPSARKFAPSTMATITTPGAIAAHGEVSTVDSAPCSSRPSDEFGGGTPRPR